MEKDHSNTLNQDMPGRISPRPSLNIDYDLYQKYLDESDLAEPQKREFLDALWSIIVSFVDLGFGVHPLQQATSEGCGQELDLTSFVTTDVISSKKGISQNQFTDAANCSNEQDEEMMDS